MRGGETPRRTMRDTTQKRARQVHRGETKNPCPGLRDDSGYLNRVPYRVVSLVQNSAGPRGPKRPWA